METTENKYKIINRDMMKYIAVFIMFWGHLFAWSARIRYPETYLYDVMPMWQQLLSHLSLFCPPVMFFFVTDGYKYSRDRKKYALRLLIFAAVTQVFEVFVFFKIEGWSGNVMFTLLFGLLEIMVWESKLKKWQRIALIILLIALDAFPVGSVWAIFGDLFILFLHIFRDKPKARFISFLSVALAWKLVSIVASLDGDIPVMLLNNLLDLIPVMLAYFCMTVLYSGKKGRHPVFAKWFFYAFYPLHYLVIWAIAKLF